MSARKLMATERPDPLRSLLDSALLDDEPVTVDDLASIREGLAEAGRGDLVSDREQAIDKQYRRRYGQEGGLGDEWAGWVDEAPLLRE